MSRRAVANFVIALLIVAFATVLWAIFYEIVVALRFNPDLPGEGSKRWGLILQQTADHSYSSFKIPFEHFWARITFWRTRQEALIRGGMAFAGVLVGGFALFIAERVNRKPTHFGAAKFGTVLDAEAARLTGKSGLILGKLGGAVLRSDEPAHVLVVGPTRSGKGVSFVVPNGLSWKGSSIWFDPKGENYLSFGRRRLEMGDKVFVFSPGHKGSHRYNPLDAIRRDEHMPTDAHVVASFLIADDGKQIWGRAARLLLAAMIGYVVGRSPLLGPKTLKEVAMLTTSEKNFGRVLKEAVEANKKQDKDNKTPEWVISGFNQFVALEEETRNSALFNVTTALNPWNSELIAAATETSDFKINDLRRTPTAIFLSLSVSEMEVLRPIVKLFIQQVHDQLMHELPGKDEPLQVLMMIDEFRQLGRMDDMVSKLTINAGYGFRVCIILQDLGQLDEVYGRSTRTTIVSACQVKLFIRINDKETSEYVSDMLGNKTARLETPVMRGNQRLFQRSDRNVQYLEMPLRSAQELREMPATKSILLIPNSPGFELTKIVYYADRPFKDLAKAIKGKPVPIPRLPLADQEDVDPKVAERARAMAKEIKPGMSAQAAGYMKAKASSPGDAPQPVAETVVQQSHQEAQAQPVILQKPDLSSHKFKSNKAGNAKDLIPLNAALRAQSDKLADELENAKGAAPKEVVASMADKLEEYEAAKLD